MIRVLRKIVRREGVASRKDLKRADPLALTKPVIDCASPQEKHNDDDDQGGERQSGT